MPNCVQGDQVGSTHRPKVDPKMESKMKCISASIFDTFQWILGSKLESKMDQKSIQKGIGKRMQKRNDFSMVFGECKRVQSDFGSIEPGVVPYGFLDIDMADSKL